jgi:hypothetical protein
MNVMSGLFRMVIDGLYTPKRFAFSNPAQFLLVQIQSVSLD